ncbi:alpha beta-hydrolase [Lentinula edodes]|uniref:Alpha beta-hydrolase n=1 Tax=Lentinula edodes TaxID=5353 RepID=A0A1Q3EGQ3_LENED|nr:alpha beta-hydrolase [Lentinula edodes]
MSNLHVGNLDKNKISQHVFDQLVHYLKYASSAYTPVCPRPNGSMLITHFSDPVAGIVEGFVARDVHRKELVVALRGSASVADVLLDTQVQLVPLVSPGVSIPHDVQVHAGFLTAWNSVGVQVLAILAEQLVLHGDIKTIVTSGHSLGGALATLSAISANQRFPQCRVITYSYGAPRTGNKAFAEFVNKSLGENAFRVVHTHDGVPTMIPQSLGYHHHGIEYWQEYEPAIAENVVKCEPQGEDPSCSLSIPSGGVNDAHMKKLTVVMIIVIVVGGHKYGNKEGILRCSGQ